MILFWAFSDKCSLRIASTEEELRLHAGWAKADVAVILQRWNRFYLKYTKEEGDL